MLTLVSNGIKRTMSVSLSDMTPEELNEFQKFVNLVIDRARPVTELREIKAKEAFDEGDDSYYRLYRPLPRYVDRTGQGSEHDKGDEE